MERKYQSLLGDKEWSPYVTVPYDHFTAEKQRLVIVKINETPHIHLNILLVFVLVFVLYPHLEKITIWEVFQRKRF